MTKLSKWISAICVVISALLIILLLTVFLVASGDDNSQYIADSKPSIMSRFEVYVNNASSEALDGIIPIKKRYQLSEDLVVAPEPDQSLFGTATSPDELEDLLGSSDKDELQDILDLLY